MKPLDECQTLEAVTVVRVTGDSGFVCQAYELGFVPGAELTVERRAPFRGPLQLRVGTVSLVMRRSDANRILCRK